jgi:hypothetical protein
VGKIAERWWEVGLVKCGGGVQERVCGDAEIHHDQGGSTPDRCLSTQSTLAEASEKKRVFGKKQQEL